MPCPTTGCWLWTATLYPHGYGVCSDWPKGNNGAHRVVYSKLVGEIPDGLHIDHLCRNRCCCNPLHLEPVTPQENLRRGEGRYGVGLRRTHCKNGHELTPDNVWMPKGTLSRKCLTCSREGLAEIRRKDPSIPNARMRAYRAAHKEKMRAYDRERRRVAMMDPEYRQRVRDRANARNARKRNQQQ